MTIGDAIGLQNTNAKTPISVKDVYDGQISFKYYV